MKDCDSSWKSNLYMNSYYKWLKIFIVNSHLQNKLSEPASKYFPEGQIPSQRHTSISFTCWNKFNMSALLQMKLCIFSLDLSYNQNLQWENNFSNRMATSTRNLSIVIKWIKGSEKWSNACSRLLNFLMKIILNENNMIEIKCILNKAKNFLWWK